MLLTVVTLKLLTIPCVFERKFEENPARKRAIIDFYFICYDFYVRHFHETYWKCDKTHSLLTFVSAPKFGAAKNYQF